MLKIPNHGMAISLDKENKCLMSYDYVANSDTITHETEGILMEVCSEIYDDIADHFSIDPSEYGLEKIDESIEMKV